MSIESVMPSNHLILCHPLLLPPSSFPSSSGSFPMDQLFTSGGQIIGASASALLKYFLNPRFYDFVTWWLRTMFKDWDAFQSLWVWFQALGRLGLSLRAVRGSLGSVRSSEPSTQQLGPSYLCSQEVMSLCFLQTGRGKKVGRSRYLVLWQEKKVYQSLLKRENVIFFYFDRVCVEDLRLSTESPTQPQYNYFSFLGILFLNRSDIMIWTFQCFQEPRTYHLCFTAAHGPYGNIRHCMVPYMKIPQNKRNVLIPERNVQTAIPYSTSLFFPQKICKKQYMSHLLKVPCFHCKFLVRLWNWCFSSTIPIFSESPKFLDVGRRVCSYNVLTELYVARKEQGARIWTRSEGGYHSSIQASMTPVLGAVVPKASPYDVQIELSAILLKCSQWFHRSGAGELRTCICNKSPGAEDACSGNDWFRDSLCLSSRYALLAQDDHVIQGI